jgi:tellurite resistance protein TerC
LEEWSITFCIAFHLLIGIFLLIDLTTRGRDPEVTFRKDVMWSIIWIVVGLALAHTVFWHYGHEEGLKYTTAYDVEKSLSVDNLFVFLVIFSYFAVPFVH